MTSWSWVTCSTTVIQPLTVWCYFFNDSLSQGPWIKPVLVSVLRHLPRDTPLRDREWKKKTSVPVWIQTYDLLITRHALYQSAASTAHRARKYPTNEVGEYIYILMVISKNLTKWIYLRGVAYSLSLQRYFKSSQQKTFTVTGIRAHYLHYVFASLRQAKDLSVLCFQPCSISLTLGRPLTSREPWNCHQSTTLR